MTWHPWRALRALGESVECRWEARRDVLGTWDQQGGEIVLHPRQSQAQRRCTLTHELVHAERGDVGECDERTELLVQEEAARRLIPIRDLAREACFYEDDLDGLAEALWVDRDTLQVRLDRLHPSERGLLRRAHATKEQTA